MNDYLAALEGMPRLIGEEEKALAGFKKNRYKEVFQEMYQSHIPTFDALEREYNLVIDKEQFLANMSEALVKEARQRMDSVTRRSLRARKQLDLNLLMVVYVFPMLQQYGGNFTDPLCEVLTADWKKAFPGESIRPATFTEIENGFHKKFCYITTAVCEVLGKEDDCYELNLFRDFRDTYMASLKEGEELIHTYYDIAPSIVKHINQKSNARQIYTSIWETWLKPCRMLIESGDKKGCLDLYKQMVWELKDRYFLK